MACTSCFHNKTSLKMDNHPKNKAVLSLEWILLAKVLHELTFFNSTDVLKHFFPFVYPIYILLLFVSLLFHLVLSQTMRCAYYMIARVLCCNSYKQWCCTKREKGALRNWPQQFYRCWGESIKRSLRLNWWFVDDYSRSMLSLSHYSFLLCTTRSFAFLQFYLHETVQPCLWCSSSLYNCCPCWYILML